MNKTMIFRLLMGLSILVAAVFWLLSVMGGILPEIPYGSIGQWIGVIIAFGWGLSFTLRGLFVKNSIPLFQRIQVIFGLALVTIGILILVEIFTWGGEDGVIIMPIIAVAAAGALLVSLIAVGGRKWDQADNEKVNSQPARKKTEWEKRQERNKRDNNN